MSRFKWIGKSIPHKEGKEVVTGQPLFVTDMKADLFVKVLRSPYPHAMIRDIDVSEAEKLPGVSAIITHKDVPKRIMPRSSARPCYILEDHLRYVGDEVAAVAAESVEIAEKAIDLIKVDYELLPAVFDPEEAAKESAPKLYPEGNVWGAQEDIYADTGRHEPTVLSWGDIDQGFKEADVILEDRFTVNSQTHSPVEPHVCVAKWDESGLTLWASTQTKSEVQDSISHVFEIPSSKVRVITKRVGGGFGGKYIERYIPITALLAKKTHGKTVKYLYTREEVQVHTKRAGQQISVKIGAKQDGTITAIYFKSYFDLGGYGSGVSGSCLFWEEAPVLAYQYQNAKFEAWDVHVNYHSSQPCRSVQTPGACFGIEQTIDELAEKLGMSCTEIREKNMSVTGDMAPPKPYGGETNVEYPRAALDAYPSKDLLKAVLKEIDWDGKWKGWGKPVSSNGSKRRGIGISYTQGWGGFNFDGFMTLAVSIYPDGSVTLLSGNQELGTGSNTTLPQIAAEYLGLDLDEVNILTGDTIHGTFDYYEARSSRTATISGHLILCAIDDAKTKICALAAPKLGIDAKKLDLREKKIFVKDDESKSIPISEVITTTVYGTGSGPPGSAFPEMAPGIKTKNLVVTAAEVEVDVETGQVEVIQITPGTCPGRIINPGMVRGQVQGGAIMGLGMALYENVNFNEKDNVWVSRNFQDYKIPTVLELPRIKPVTLEDVTEGRPPNVGGPYGARGTGEWGVSQVVPAIANAIYNALGIRLRRCPMLPEVILETLKEGE